MRALSSARHSPMHSSALPWQLGRRGEKRNRAHPGPKAQKWGTPGNQTTSRVPSPAPLLQTSTRSARERLPHARGNNSLPSAGSSLATQLQGNFPSL